MKDLSLAGHANKELVAKMSRKSLLKPDLTKISFEKAVWFVFVFSWLAGLGNGQPLLVSF